MEKYFAFAVTPTRNAWITSSLGTMITLLSQWSQPHVQWVVFQVKESAADETFNTEAISVDRNAQADAEPTAQGQESGRLAIQTKRMSETMSPSCRGEEMMLSDIIVAVCCGRRLAQCGYTRLAISLCWLFFENSRHRRPAIQHKNLPYLNYWDRELCSNSICITVNT